MRLQKEQRSTNQANDDANSRGHATIAMSYYTAVQPRNVSQSKQVVFLAKFTSTKNPK